jgi:hypothetical protein
MKAGWQDENDSTPLRPPRSLYVVLSPRAVIGGREGSEQVQGSEVPWAASMLPASRHLAPCRTKRERDCVREREDEDGNWLSLTGPL